MEGDEIYDVITEEGTVLYQATWTECHTKGLLHAVACLLLWKDDSRQELFLQKRSAHMKQLPGLWQHSVGGHVKTGETIERAMMSEIKEELFYDIDIPDIKLSYLGKFMNQDFENNNEILHLYEGFYSGPFSSDPKEVDSESRFLSLEEIRSKMKKNPDLFTPSFRAILDFYSTLK